MADVPKYSYTVLEDYRFLYVPELRDVEAFWPANRKLVRIAQMLGETNGTSFGRVTLTLPHSNIIEGEVCIRKLIPIRKSGERMPMIYLRKRHSFRMFGDGNSSSSGDEFQSEESSSLADTPLLLGASIAGMEDRMERLEKKLDRVLALLLRMPQLTEINQ